MTKQPWAILSGVLALVPTAAWSQSLNLDTGTATTAPPAGYAGAAGLPGFWNNYAGNDSAPFPLLDLSGRTSSATFSMNLPFGPASYAHPTLSGDDALLLEDYFDLHSSRADFTLTGLMEGHYTVYTYAWAPDNPNVQISVDVNGVGAQLIGGPWPGSQTLGTTYARHEVDIQKEEALDIFVRGVPNNGTLNGIQLKFRPGFADAGGADTGLDDLGEVPDADLADAGDLDAAGSELGPADAGSPEGGVLDSGAAADGGVAADAGAIRDAGGAADAGAGRTDAGAGADSGSADGEAEGCGCQGMGPRTSGALLWGMLALGWLARRPRASR